MKVIVKRWNAVAQWRWDTRIIHSNSNSNNEQHQQQQQHQHQQQQQQHQQPEEGTDDGEDDVCGICRVAYEACCSACKTPGDDCPLIWGKCSHVFHMHCLLKWLGTAASKGQCPMDRREWDCRTVKARSYITLNLHGVACSFEPDVRSPTLPHLTLLEREGRLTASNTSGSDN